jgi:hypothetical protein
MAYVGHDGDFIFDTNIDTIKFVLQNMTGAPRVVAAPTA